MEDLKPIYTSKTFWLAVVTTATPLITAAFPPLGVFLAANADWIAAGIGLAFGGLRMVTDTGVRVK